MKKFVCSLFLLFAACDLQAHCQIPCGIYHDQMVVQGMQEDVQTLTKSVNEILANEGKSAQDQNQLVRWVLNKEKHADKLADTLVEYFLKQRIKPDDEQVEAKAVKVHALLVLTMKVKQTVDVKTVESLEQELNKFIKMMYPEDLMEHSHD